MKNLNLKKIIAAVAIVVVAGGLGVQSASALEVNEMNPIITSKTVANKKADTNKFELPEVDEMNPIITSRNFVKEENKMDIRITASIDDVMNPIITSETILSHK